jgi:hypothetical protein
VEPTIEVKPVLLVIAGSLLFLASLALPASDALPPGGSSAAQSSQNDKPVIEEPVDSGQTEERRYRLLPVPILITEPAIGTGLGAVLALFHPVKQGKPEHPRVATPESLAAIPTSRDAPPVFTALVGAYTDNDTWAAGLAHSNNWRNDSLRYLGALGVARVNSTVFLLNRPVQFSMEATMLLQDFKFRLGASDWMLGAGMVYMDAQNRFGNGAPDTGEDERFAYDLNNVALVAKALYETRDSSMNPTSGKLFELDVSRFDGALGGGFDYWSWKARALSFHPLADKVILGLRLEVSGVDGRPPFFGYPWVKLRGIPALRYQDSVTGELEIEARYRLLPRWELSAFAGLGYTNDDVPLFDNPGSIYNFGLGGRYKVFDAHNVWMGVDIARGPENWNGYIQVGHPW